MPTKPSRCILSPGQQTESTPRRASEPEVYSRHERCGCVALNGTGHSVYSLPTSPAADHQVWARFLVERSVLVGTGIRYLPPTPGPGRVRLRAEIAQQLG